MNRLTAAVVLLLAAAPARAVPWAGKLDLTSPLTLGGWQSIKSADQATGLSKRLFHLDAGDQPVLNVGLFGGVSKPLLTAPSGAPHALGGLTVAVPGSTLDWALGTSWGAAWLPKLKTGILAAYDLTRIKALKAVPDFVGVGFQWPLGGAQ